MNQLNDDMEQFIIFDNENFTTDNADNSIEQISKSDEDSGNYTIGENNSIIKIDDKSVCYSLSDLSRKLAEDGFIKNFEKVSDKAIFDLLPLARKILNLIS